MNLARARELGISRQLEPCLGGYTHYVSPQVKRKSAALPEGAAAWAPPSPPPSPPPKARVEVEASAEAEPCSPEPSAGPGEPTTPVAHAALPPWELPPGFVLDLSNWQAQLERLLWDCSLFELRLPGTHDSGAYALSRRYMAPSKLPSWLLSLNRRASWLTRPFTRLVVRWGEAQRLDIVGQLRAGARYLDIRVVNVKGVFHVAHGMLGTTCEDVLCQVGQFLDEHPGEVVIVDANHFHRMKCRADHQAFLAVVSRCLGRHMANRQSLARDAPTFGNVRDTGKRCILLYGGADFLGVAAEARAVGCWPRTEREMVSPWPRAGSLRKLLARLPGLDASSGRARGFFVLQGVVTPNGRLVRRGLVLKPSSLRQLAQRVTPEVCRLVVTGVLEARCIVLLDHIELADVASLILAAYAPQLRPCDPAARSDAKAAVAAAEAAEAEAEAAGAVDGGLWLDGAEACEEGLVNITHMLLDSDDEAATRKSIERTRSLDAVRPLRD